MKKVFLLLFVSFCFGFTGLVLWTSPAHASPPFPVPPQQPGGGQASAAQQIAPVPQTGQITCWDSAGFEIDCADTGQDGDIQAGVIPPDPRFTDNGDGTVTDNLTRVVWPKDANCLGGTRTWQQALDFANGLEDGDCGLTDGSMAGDWYLPNRNQLLSLHDLENFNPALPTGHPFMNFQEGYYWSSTTDFDFSFNAWLVDFAVGFVDVDDKDNSHFVTAVRGRS